MDNAILDEMKVAGRDAAIEGLTQKLPSFARMTDDIKELCIGVWQLGFIACLQVDIEDEKEA
jgi:hypothetical protein